MNARMRWTLLVVAVLAPAAAWAQHQAPAAKPARESSRPAPPAPEGDAHEEGEFADEWFALGAEDELMSLEGEGDDERIEDSVGPGGERRLVRRQVERMRGRRGMHGMMRHGMHRGGHARGMLARWAQLDLTEAQRTKLRDLHEAQARKAVQRRADMQLARMDLHKLLREDRPSSASVNAQIDKLTRLHADQLRAMVDTRMQARSLLTPEQAKQLRERPGPARMRHEMGDWEVPQRR